MTKTLIAALVLALGTGACGGGQSKPTETAAPADTRSLYERLGGTDAITLDTFKVPEREKGEVLAAFRSMQGDVVENP
jgi:ABC-type glycerol-3-phosphate transport system substrate-binding protein